MDEGDRIVGRVAPGQRRARAVAERDARLLGRRARGRARARHPRRAPGPALRLRAGRTAPRAAGDHPPQRPLAAGGREGRLPPRGPRAALPEDQRHVGGPRDLRAHGRGLGAACADADPPPGRRGGRGYHGRVPFPRTRLRRLRRTPVLRDLVRETRLDAGDLVLPLFVEAGPRRPRADRARCPASTASRSRRPSRRRARSPRSGSPRVLLFGIPADKDEEGSGAWDDEGIVQLATRAIKDAHPDLLVITDVCLCEYTSHGHCGLLRADGAVDNDAIARAARAHRGQPGARGRRRRRAERHDGRARRRDPRRARRRGLRRHADHRLQREVRLRLLRPVPRGRRTRRPPSATAAATRWTRPTRDEALREVAARRRGGRRRRHGQARAGLPRRHPPRQGRDAAAGRRLQRQRRVRDGQGRRRRRLRSTSAPSCSRR